MERMTKPGHMANMKVVFNRVFTTVKLKNESYTAGSPDPYANFRMSEMEDVHPMSGTMIRTNDKMQRIRSFINAVKAGDDLTKYQGPTGVQDDLDDIIGYALILHGMAREELGTTATAEVGTAYEEDPPSTSETT